MPIERPMRYFKTVKGKSVVRESKISTYRKIKEERKSLSGEDIKSLLNRKLTGDTAVRFLLSKGLDARQLKLRQISIFELVSKFKLSSKDLKSLGYTARDLASVGFSQIEVNKLFAELKKKK